MSSAAVYTTSTVRKNLQLSAKEVTRYVISDSPFHKDEEFIAAAMTTGLASIVPKLKRNQKSSRPLLIIVFVITCTFATDAFSYLTEYTDQEVMCYHKDPSESGREAVQEKSTESTSHFIVMA